MVATTRKILLVEDERSIADTVTYALKTEGFEALRDGW
jgi:DNA-binding response OmpR family regulator